MTENRLARFLDADMATVATTCPVWCNLASSAVTIAFDDGDIDAVARDAARAEVHRLYAERFRVSALTTWHHQVRESKAPVHALYTDAPALDRAVSRTLRT